MTKTSNKDQQRYIVRPLLPLRDGQEGRFLGVYNARGRYIAGIYHGQRFTGECQVRGVRRGARFRNETLGITFEFSGVMWEPILVDEPNACRHCDTPQRDHCQRWIDQPGVGSHGWIPPTDTQRLHRMRWRRFLGPQGRGSKMPKVLP